MKRAAIVCLTLIMVILACRSLTFGSQSGKETEQNQGVSTETSQVPEQPAATLDTSNYFLADPAVGLNDLQSYVQVLSISFSGTRDGEPFEYRDDYRQEFNREQDTQFIYTTAIDPEGMSIAYVAGHMGEAYYSRRGDEPCVVSWGKRGEGELGFIPTELLPLLLAAREGSLEDINGIKTRRYDIDGPSLGYPTAVQAEGQVWLAEDGGFVVKYTLRLQDAEGYIGEGLAGEQLYEYELDQVNSFADPELPEGCLAVLSDFPAPADATDIQRLPNVLAFSSASDAAQIQAYYEEELPRLGWSLGNSHSLATDGAVLVFANEEKSLNAYITLQNADQGVWVTVKVEPMEETQP